MKKTKWRKRREGGRKDRKELCGGRKTRGTEGKTKEDNTKVNKSARRQQVSNKDDNPVTIYIHYKQGVQVVKVYGQSPSFSPSFLLIKIKICT